jgi:hypothetical protein
MDERWLCWRCGADLADFPRPYGRYAQCPACRADLHVCLMCKHHDTRKAKQCREAMAEAVEDKARANACEWFQPRCGAQPPAAGKSIRPSRLDALFGTPTDVPPSSPDAARRALDELFGGNG